MYRSEKKKNPKHLIHSLLFLKMEIIVHAFFDYVCA